MGVDVNGKNPASEAGESFGNNWWWWRPLWDYCHAIAPDLVSDELWKAGHYNDGAGLDEVGSKKLAFRLKGAIAEGHTARYEVQNKARIDAIPLLECQYCKGTGVRTDAVGVANGMPARKYCNGCESTGKVKHMDAHYPFSEANAKEFALFLEACGGFEIT